MAELDQQFVEYVVKALVDNPDAVKVERSVDDMGTLLELTVDPADMGKVIGKAGATAKSIRTLLRVLGAKNDERVNLKIVEPEGSERPERPARDEQPQQAEQQNDVEADTEEIVPEPEVEEESDFSARTRADLDELDDDF
jgi:predicted RNA-binding protein YlqC (UPF0109 family)